MQLGHLFSRFFCRPLNVNFPEWMVVGKIVIVRSGHSDLDPRLARLLPEAADQEPEEASSQSEGVAEVPDEVCRKSGEPVGDADVVGELEDGRVAQQTSGPRRPEVGLADAGVDILKSDKK